MKSFDNPNMKFSLLLPSRELDLCKIPFDDVSQSFITTRYPMSLSFSEFDLLCEEKRKILNSDFMFDREYLFSSIPFSKEVDAYLPLAVSSYFLDLFKTGKKEDATFFMLCFLERYSMEHEEVVSLFQRREYQRNSFVKRYNEVHK